MPPGASPSGNSYLSTFKRCRRKFYYQQVRGLRPKGRVAALDIGTLTHEGLALLSEQGFDKAIIYIKELWEKEMKEGYSDTLPFDMASFLLKEYVNIYKVDPFTPLVEEHEFSFLLPNGSIYTGKCDKLVRGPGGKIYVMEHKTTGLNPAMYLRTFYLDPQITGYYIGAAEAVKGLGGEGIAGIILDVIGKPRKLKSGFGRPTFSREVFTRTTEDIEAFLSSTGKVFEAIDECKRIRETLEQECVGSGKDAYYRCEHECFSFNKACAYLELCRYGEDEHFIEEMFTHEENHKA